MKIKMPSSYTILFFIIIVVAILTAVVPAGKYDPVCTDKALSSITLSGDVKACVNKADYEKATVTDIEATVAAVNGDKYTGTGKALAFKKDTKLEYHKIDNNTQGLWQILNAPVNGFYDAKDICLFVLVIGGFIGIVMKTGAMEAGVGRLLIKLKGRELYAIPVLMVLFGIGGSTYGMAEETIGFYPLIIPIMLAAGFDTVTGVMVILFGAGIGVLGSTVNPFAIGAASSAAGVSPGSGIVLRAIMWVIIDAFTIWYVMNYAKKVKTDIRNSKLYDLYDEHVEHFLKDKDASAEAPEFKSGHGLILWLFGLTFIFMVCSVLPWGSFNINLFADINAFLNKSIVLMGVSGGVALGDWWFGELTMLFLVMSIIIGGYAKAKGLLSDPISAFISGSRDLLGVALIIGLSRGIKIVMDGGGMSPTLLYYGSNALSGLSNTMFVILNYIFYIPMSFLIPSTSGLANASMPIMGPMGELVTHSKVGTDLVITGYSAASGIVNLITPTSGVVMGGLAIARIPFDRWVRIAMPFLAIVFVMSIVILGVAAVVQLH